MKLPKLALVTLVTAGIGILSALGQRFDTMPDSAPDPSPAKMETASGKPVRMSSASSVTSLRLAETGAKVSAEEISIVAPARRATADDFTGTWIQVNTSVFNDAKNSPTIKVERNGDAYIVTGLYIADSKVNATYNSTSGVLEITPQTVYNHETYGACGLHTFTVSGTKVVMDATSPITMSIAADGTMQMSPWGLFVESGPYKGSAFDAFYGTVAGHPNGTFKSQPFSADFDSIDAQVWIRQVNEGEAVVANMLGNGRPFSITLDHKGAYIMSQFVMNMSLYGDFYLFAATSAGKIDKNNYISVTAKEGGYDIGRWGVFCLASTSISAATGKTSELITDFKFSYPSAGENTMTGSGSADDPYVVVSADQLRYIALTTTSANSYADKYFRLGADLDLSGFGGHWYPIGSSLSEPFQGIFDGNGKTISGLTQNFGGTMGAGIFGFTGAKSVLRNIKVSGISYTGCGKYIGGLAAYAQGLVENCSVQGRIEATNNEIAGVVAYSTGVINGCSFSGYLYGGIDIGGITAYTTGSVTNCTSTAYVYLNTHVPYTLTSTHALGGIAAAAYGTASKPVTITGCMASGIVADLHASDHIGGIVGYGNNTEVSQCLSNVLVSTNSTQAVDGGSPAAGGIIGYMGKGSVEDCLVAGSVNGAGTKFAGGVAGYGGGASSFAVTYRRNLVVGMVNTASEWDKVGATGSHFTSAMNVLTVADCYYDYQTTGLDTIAVGCQSTASLTSGTLPSGFSSDVWTVKAGQYPMLKIFGDAPAAILASAPLMLPEGQTIRKVTNNFTVATPGSVKWGVMLDSGQVGTESEGLTVSGNNVTIKPQYAGETLVAYLPDNTYRSYLIKVTPKVFEGDGTASSPYLIQNVQDLLTLQKAVNEAGQPHKGDYFRLTADLDLSQTPSFTGIAAGKASYSFGGTFDGAGHRISNFHIASAVKGSDGKLATAIPYMGFFGICTKTSTVKNLIIDPSCSFAFYRYSAPVVGYTAGRVENCLNYAPVQSSGIYNGGVVGLAAETTAVVTGCANFGPVTAADGFTGGVAGVNYGLIEKCFNAGKLTLQPDAAVSTAGDNANLGGIVGANFGDVISSGNNGQITALTSAGGIVGGNSSEKGFGSVTDCQNTAVVYGDSTNTNIGAIIGNLASAGKVSGNYYDMQLMPSGATGKGDGTGNKGILTTEFNVATAGSSTWYATDGYPVPAVMKGNADVIKALSVTLTLNALDNVEAMENGATLSGTDATWRLLQAGPFGITGKQLTLNLGDSGEGRALLEVSTPFGTKEYSLHAVAAIFGGAGTKADPHVISSPADMNRLAGAVSNGRNYARHYFRVSNDLDFSATEYSPTGSLSTPFQGIIDGAGHRIVNLKLDRSEDYAGLFGYCGAFSELHDLTMDSTCAISGNAFTGAFAGRFDGMMKGCINRASVSSTDNYCGGFAGYMGEGSSSTDCKNYGPVNGGGTYVGGFAGVLYGDVSNGVNYASVKGKTTYVGGFTGSLRSRLENCQNRGEVASVSGGNYLGGIAASVEAGSALINCVNHAPVVNGKAYVGGLYGGCPTAVTLIRANSAIIEGCANYGAIVGSGTNVAGLAGLVAPGHHMRGCVNYGNVTGSGNTSGGVIGETRGNANYSTTVDSCFNYGSVVNTVSGKKDVGGIIGKLATYSTLTRCGNYGDVTTTGYMTGGIAGDITGNMADCYNLGNVSGGTYAVGGIAGYGGSGITIERCVNGGSVKTTASYTGNNGTAAGICGYGYPVIIDCANFGDVYGSKTVGGIAGSRFSGLDIIRCMNTGRISAPEGVASVGNIFGSQYKFTGPAWYDREVNGTLAADHTSYIGLTSSELMSLHADGWKSSVASYPVPSSLAEVAAVRFAAARYQLHEGDTVTAVKHRFFLADYPGLTWSSSDPDVIFIEGNVARVKQATNRPVTLTLSWNGHEKKFNFIVNRTVGVEGIGAQDVVSVTYYDFSGLPVANPVPGTFCIRRTVFVDGSVKTEKICF